jgi:hypothetical protein
MPVDFEKSRDLGIFEASYRNLYRKSPNLAATRHFMYSTSEAKAKILKELELEHLKQKD